MPQASHSRRQASSPLFTLQDVVRREHLKRAAEALNAKHRATRLKETVLARNALEWAAEEWTLDEIVEAIRRDLAMGTYTPHAPTVLHIARDHGLTRRTHTLSFVDALLYKALVLGAESSLLSETRRWTAFGGGQRDYQDSSWWIDWMRNQVRRRHLTERAAFILETDVANFFPTISLSLLEDRLRGRSSLDDSAVDLLGFILRSLASIPSRRGAAAGIPVEEHDCSRVLAHFFLLPLDEALDAHGRNGQYTRYVDDVLVAATSKPEAVKIARRIQDELARLELHPNPSKTRVVASADALDDRVDQEDRYLRALEHATRRRERVEQPALLARFLAIGADLPPGRSRERLQKRYLRWLRAFSVDEAIAPALELLRSSGSLARGVLDFLSVFPISLGTLQQLRECTADHFPVYDDVPCLTFESLSAAPNGDELSVRRVIAEWAQDVYRETYSTRPAVAACAIVACAKFGTSEHFSQLESFASQHRGREGFARQHALAALVGHTNLSTADVRRRFHGFGDEGERQLRFLGALEDKNAEALKIVLRLLEPVRRGEPRRLVFRARPLLLTRLVQRDAAAWDAQFQKPHAELLAGASPLSDRAALRLLDVAAA